MAKRSSWGWSMVVLLGAGRLVAAEREVYSGSKPGAAVVVVLDASSSMVGAMGKSTKIKVAREVAHDVVKDWDPRLSVGLTAYGHRQAKSCQDIEAVVPLGPLDREAFNTAVDQLKPKGKTPLAAAIRNAADQLGYAQRQATVIVITDGIENCGGDPCAVVAELKQKGFDFTAHVVGLGSISKAESKQLSCIAEKTGGEYRGAKDAPTLRAALSGLMQGVEVQSGLRAPISSESGALLHELSEETSGNVKIRAVRTPGGEPLTTMWRIYNEDAIQQVALADQKKEATFELGPGKYRLRARASNINSNAQVDLPFEVSSGKHHVLELAYNSGIITFETYDFEGGPAAQSVFRIAPDDVKGGGTRVDGVAADYRSAPEFELFAGKYTLEAQLGNAVVTRRFEVKPGAQTSQKIALNVGRVTLRAAASPGGPQLTETHWKLFSLDASGAEGKAAGFADYRGEVDFILAQGDYVAKVQIDGGPAGKQRFSIKAGDNASQEVVVGD